MYRIYFLFLGFLLVSLANAGTVTLSGSCSVYLVNNSITFTLSNLGNDSAYNLIVSPIITGATPINSSYQINSLNPNENYTIHVQLSNFGIPGTYAEEFLVSYQQGLSVFTALFPCQVAIIKPTVSPIYETVRSSIQSNIAIVNVSLYNVIGKSFSGNVSLLVPPEFSYLSNKSYEFHIGPYNSSNFTFKLKLPTGKASYTLAAVSSFISDNEHYASMSIFSLNGIYSSSLGPTIYILIVVIPITLIILLLVFMIFRMLFRKGKSPKRTAKRSKGS